MIAERAEEQSWDNLETVHDLPECGRGVKVTPPFTTGEVVCAAVAQRWQGKVRSDKGYIVT